MMKTNAIKSLFVLAGIMLLFAVDMDAQRWKRTRYEVIYGGGIINGFTDLGGANRDGRHILSDIDLQGTRPNIAVGARYKIRELLAVKLNIAFAWLKSSDTYTQWDSRQNRNVISNAPLIEQSLQCEYSIQKERFGTRYTFSNLRRFQFRNVNTYIYLGVGGVLAMPRLKNNYWTNVNAPHHAYNLVFPMGIGFKYGINRRLSFGIDIGHRYTTSDYLEGFSDIHSTGKDSYLLLIFNLAYKLRTARSGLPKF